LIVDDSLVDQRLVSGLLAAGGYEQVHVVSNGREAIDAMRRQRPAMVITDLVMPEMDGLQLVRAVVREFTGVPVVLMTGYGSEDIAVQALRAGAASYVPKRALQQLLLETVSRILAIPTEADNDSRLLARMTGSECEFDLDNDLSLVPPLIGYLRCRMTQVAACDDVMTIRVSVALEEALLNAIFHGNLELGSEIRDLDHDIYQELLEKRRTSAPYRNRRVKVTGRFRRDRAEFVIRDEGPGFDPEKLPDPTELVNLDKTCGRGVLLMRTFMDQIHYNDSGNEVTMTKLLGGVLEPATVH
jgi:CheY-like chemotaxis protein/anti-sigma regulatory factor (Ser/Thr protein kinase)